MKRKANGKESVAKRTEVELEKVGLEALPRLPLQLIALYLVPRVGQPSTDIDNVSAFACVSKILKSVINRDFWKLAGASLRVRAPTRTKVIQKLTSQHLARYCYAADLCLYSSKTHVTQVLEHGRSEPSELVALTIVKSSSLGFTVLCAERTDNMTDALYDLLITLRDDTKLALLKQGHWTRYLELQITRLLRPIPAVDPTIHHYKISLVRVFLPRYSDRNLRPWGAGDLVHPLLPTEARITQQQRAYGSSLVSYLNQSLGCQNHRWFYEASVLALYGALDLDDYIERFESMMHPCFIQPPQSAHWEVPRSCFCEWTQQQRVGLTDQFRARAKLVCPNVMLRKRELLEEQEELLRELVD